MTNSHHTPTAEQVAAEYRGHIAALQKYLARVGTRPEVINEAVAEAVAQASRRPDIDRPMAFMSTIARNEAERLSVELDAVAPQLQTPDLLAVLNGEVAQQPARSRRSRAPAGPRPERLPLS